MSGDLFLKINSNCQMQDTKKLLNIWKNPRLYRGNEEIENPVSSIKLGVY